MKNVTAILTILLAVSMLTACGKGDKGDTGATGATGPAAPTPAPVVTTPLQQEIQSLVDSENVYREGLGQTELSAGLSCTLWTITGGQYISSSSPGATAATTIAGLSQKATWLLTSSFNQPNTAVSAGLNILPVALQGNPAYQNLIYVRCTGNIVIPTSDYYTFDLQSDDGSLLYINNALLINNDGNHGITEKQGQVYLRSGVYPFRLDFAQTGAGNQALILEGAESNGSLGVIDPMFFFH